MAEPVIVDLGQPGAVVNTIGTAALIPGPPGVAPSDLAPVATSGSYADLTGKPAIPTPTVFRALDHGITGDGTTDDGPALNALLRQVRDLGGGVIVLDGTSAGYAVGSLTLQSGVTLQGSTPGVVLTKTGTSPTWINCSAGSANLGIENLTLDARGLVTSYMVEISPDVAGFRMAGCSLISTGGNGAQGLETRDRVTGVVVTDCLFDGLRTGARINRDGLGITITRCEFVDWIDRAIYMYGTATHSSQNVWITDNTIRPHAGGIPASSVRQPIAILGVDTMPHRNVHVSRNTVLGAGTDYSDGTGSADLISLHRVDGFEVSGNFVVDGGDVGITVAQQCRNGVVVGNVALRNDSAGICIGSVNSDSTHNVAVTGNTCVNNGQDRMGETGTPDYVRCGIRVARATDISITGNSLGDDQAVGTQLHGVSLVDSTNVHLTANTNSNVTTAYYLDGDGNSGITQAVTEAVTP